MTASPLPAFERELVARRGFEAFIPLAWPHVDLPRLEPLVWDWHMHEQAVHWEGLYRGWIDELCVNVPPGQSKTVISGILLPAWIWTIDPSYRFMFLSYAKSLAIKAAKSSIKLVCSAWYQQRWGHTTRLVGGENAPGGEHFTTAGGSRFSTGLGSTATGVHAHMVIVDDPVKAQDAFSANKKLRARLIAASDAIGSTLGSRGVGGNSAFKFGLVMQRLHEVDPSQVLVDRGATHLMLPEKFEPERRCTTVLGGDHRTVEGELLNPKRFDEKAHARRVRDIGKGAGYSSLAVQAQLQQRPQPPGGAIFKGPFKRFNIADVPLQTTNSIISLDCTFKAGDSNDFVGIEVWGARGGNFYLYYSDMKHLGFWATIQELGRLLEVWKVITVIIEDAANGPAVVETLREQLGMVNVEAVPANGGIEALAHAAGAYYSAGKVFHANEPWAAQKERNLQGYPAGVAHDDDTAAGAQAIRHLALQSSTLADALAQWQGAGLAPKNTPPEIKVKPGEMFSFQAQPTSAPAVGVYLWPHSVQPEALAALDAGLRALAPASGELDTAGGTVKVGGWVLARSSSPRLLAATAVAKGLVARAGEFVLG